jgi:hypothetical protein
MKRLAYTALVRPILEYGAVCWDPYREGHVSDLNRLQKRGVEFSNNINESGWKTSAQRRLIARICAFFKIFIGVRTWKAIEDGLLKTCYLSREDHNGKIRSRKERIDVGQYSFVKWTIKSWKQLSAGLLASFPSTLNTFGNMVKNVVTSKGTQVDIQCKQGSRGVDRAEPRSSCYRGVTSVA